MSKTKQLYEDNGVELSKSTISVGDEITLLYSGLLAQSGADSIYAHIGYGDNWEGKEFIPMEKMEDKFKATIKVNLSDKLNVAFKDGVDNWDNNSQLNYSFNVAKRAEKSSTSEEKKTTAKVKATSMNADAAKETAETKQKVTKAKTTVAKASAPKATAAPKAAAAKATAAKATAAKAPAAKKSTASKSTGAKKTTK
nr:carbohydrate-binding protein [Acetivibrio cellulolyticus]